MVKDFQDPIIVPRLAGDFTASDIAQSKNAASLAEGEVLMHKDGSAQGVIFDHGELPGLADDDHTQYALADGTRAPAKIGFSHVVGHYYSDPQMTLATGVDVVTGNIITYHPFPVFEDTPWDRIAIDVDTIEAGKLARLGVYNDSGAGQPSTLITDHGTVSLGSTGIAQIVISPAQELAAGWYWLAFHSNATGVAKVTVNGPGGGVWIMLTGGRGVITEFLTAWLQVQVFGTLPATASGLVILATTPAPRVAMRAA